MGAACEPWVTDVMTGPRVVHRFGRSCTVLSPGNSAYGKSCPDPGLQDLAPTWPPMWKRLLKSQDQFVRLDPTVFLDPEVTSEHLSRSLRARAILTPVGRSRSSLAPDVESHSRNRLRCRRSRDATPTVPHSPPVQKGVCALPRSGGTRA